ncbi:CRISPR-associated helicase Cas3' [Actinobacteria bacterium YIM 96077]|uniref:CRISPR-associated helicase/endonuclease Cas3 n=2 Tax=Phytoactinopolyspora halophila TaxID=1981511 RepID=A0A329QJ93_9ACTN|nr:CRISPR-associated helicase Cas3' [Actinobacteria bacterium YIM 96077]RAW11991.1 CRISPR-associated helicase/endonuclease Cas3 [Phytoactinopolyspora halophila]
MDDSADVAGQLFDEWLSRNVVDLIAAEFAGDVVMARTACRFLAGVHDIGKATPAFAVQHTLLGQQMSGLGLFTPAHKNELMERERAHHTVTGHHIFKRWLRDRGWPGRAAEAWAVVLGGHHGTPPEPVDLDCTPRAYPKLYGEGLWCDVWDELLERQAGRTGAVEHLEKWADVKFSQQAQVLQTGLVILADWIASNEELFPFHADDLPHVTDRTDRARRALRSLRLPVPWRAALPHTTTEELFTRRFAFPDGATPRPVQASTVDVAGEMSEPGLLVVEAPMGEGKTEAALAAAEILASRWGAGGLFVALPTQATSDAMFARVVDWLDAIGADHQQIGGSIMLAHGKKQFNRLFRGFVSAGRTREIDRDQQVGGNRRRKEPAHRVVAHSWLTGRKKAQLANFTIGTIDQLLFAGLKARHLMLRHLALAGKVVVIDEIHAYDAYMNSYLLRVLTWLGAYRVPVVALSATLPGYRRRELVEAYRRGRARAVSGTADDVGASDAEATGSNAETTGATGEIDGDIGYPVLTWTDGNDVHTRVAEPSGRGTSVHVDALECDEHGDDSASLIAILRDKLSGGGTALVVRNTVNRVLATAEWLEDEFPGEITVTHARFITADRVRNDERLLDLFGSPSRAVHRPTRHIVVSSQVVEQSLDVDFDLLVTDLAPIDLVLQRMGRLHRHQRGVDQTDRPAKLRTARTYIGGTDMSRDPPALEPVAARYVYDAHVLYRAAAVLTPRLGGVVELPADIAPLVQRAYGGEPVGPDSWQEAMAGAEQTSRESSRRREDKAGHFQINDPAKPGKAIVGWITASAGEADEEAQGQGQVRDGAPSLEAMLVQRSAAGVLHTPSWLAEEGGREIPADDVPPDDLAEVMAACAIRLPLTFSNADAEEELWSATPPSWEHSHLIFRLPALVVDEHGWAEINGRRVRYTAARGLEVFADDGG